MKSSLLHKLAKWYKKHCDEKWEHYYGIKIETLDNPGWLIKIDLKDTELERKYFQPIKKGEIINNITPEDWINCYVENKVFYGAGDPNKLEEILKIFFNWAEDK